MNDLGSFQIWIPTRGRTQQQVTLRYLPLAILPKTVVVCPREEYGYYLDNWGCLGVTVIQQEANLANIAEKRAWMLRRATKYVERLLMLDDDCYFFARCPPTKRRWDEKLGYWVPKPGVKLLSLDYATPKKLMSTFEEVNELLRVYPHGGLGSRNGNHLEPGEVAYTTRAMHAIAFDVEVFNRVVMTKNRVQCREDFDYTLQLLRFGYDNAVITHTVVSPGSYGAKGGCFDERSVEKSNSDALRLVELHPGLVRTVEKTYKNVPRLEVHVQWKQAYKQGCEKYGERS